MGRERAGGLIVEAELSMSCLFGSIARDRLEGWRAVW